MRKTRQHRFWVQEEQDNCIGNPWLHQFRHNRYELLGQYPLSSKIPVDTCNCSYLNSLQNLAHAYSFRTGRSDPLSTAYYTRLQSRKPFFLLFWPVESSSTFSRSRLSWKGNTCHCFLVFSHCRVVFPLNTRIGGLLSHFTLSSLCVNSKSFLYFFRKVFFSLACIAGNSSSG